MCGTESWTFRVTVAGKEGLDLQNEDMYTDRRLQVLNYFKNRIGW